jgi:hypothetical protein
MQTTLAQQFVPLSYSGALLLLLTGFSGGFALAAASGV